MTFRLKDERQYENSSFIITRHTKFFLPLIASQIKMGLHFLLQEIQLFDRLHLFEDTGKEICEVSLGSMSFQKSINCYFF